MRDNPDSEQAQPEEDQSSAPPKGVSGELNFLGTETTVDDQSRELAKDERYLAEREKERDRVERERDRAERERDKADRRSYLGVFATIAAVFVAILIPLFVYVFGQVSDFEKDLRDVRSDFAKELRDVRDKVSDVKADIRVHEESHKK